MFSKDEQLVYESPAREVARQQAFTEKTSRLAFFLEDQLRGRYESLIKQFLFQAPEKIIASGAPSFGLVRRLRCIRLSSGGGTYGYYAPPDIELPQWVYEQEGFGEDIVDCPRLLITTSASEYDLPGLNRGEVRSRIIQRSSKEEQWRLDLGVHAEDSELTRFTYRPLMLLMTLYTSGELGCSWADIEALGTASFAPRLLSLKNSIKVLFEGDGSLVRRILRRVDPHGSPTVRRIFLHSDR